MERPKAILAQHDGFGRIFECECGCIHLHLGPVSINLSVDGYVQLVDLVNTSAANFEIARSLSDD